MRSLEKSIEETIALGIISDEKPGYGKILYAVHGTSGLSYHFEIGFHFPLHTSAPGKAIMAYLPEDECKKVLDTFDFKRYTKSTITTKEDFYAELQEVRKNGFSIDVSEQVEGCHCVGVPIFDENGYPIAGIWTTGVSGSIPVRRFAKIAEILREGSVEITSRMKGKGRNTDRKYINQVVEKAESIMQQSINKQLDMEQLARNLYVGYSWFRKAFKEKTGLSPNQYHLSCRMGKAKDLLETTTMPVKKIAEELGFESQHNFSALFKKKSGLSPNQYRSKT